MPYPEETLQILGLCPWYGLRPNKQGQSPHRGHSPISISQLSGGAEPRLTSGGEAGAEMHVDFHDHAWVIALNLCPAHLRCHRRFVINKPDRFRLSSSKLVIVKINMNFRDGFAAGFEAGRSPYQGHSPKFARFPPVGHSPTSHPAA